MSLSPVVEAASPFSAVPLASDVLPSGSSVDSVMVAAAVSLSSVTGKTVSADSALLVSASGSGALESVSVTADSSIIPCASGYGVALGNIPNCTPEAGI